MDIKKTINDYSYGREEQMKRIFTNLFILQNRLQTLFDKVDSNMTIKQFMLLIIIKMSDTNETFTNYGKTLGCSRQNIKKLINLLEKNKYVKVYTDKLDSRKSSVELTKNASEYFSKFSDVYSEKLDILFENYSDEDINIFYSMIGKLYNGIERLENK